MNELPDTSRTGTSSALRDLVEEITLTAKRHAAESAAAPTDVRPWAVPDVGLLPARLVVKGRADSIGVADPPETLRSLGLPVAELFSGAGELENDSFGLHEYFVVELPGSRAAVGLLGQDLAYGLADDPEIVAAYYEEPSSIFMPLGSVLGGGTPPSDKDWHRKAIRVPPAGLHPVTGLVIGHPDTGWALHPELDTTALDLVNQWNTLTESPDATDPMDFVLFNGHGTAAGALMVGSSAGQLSGVAPSVRLLPIRCAQSVVLVLDVELAQAIWHAIRKQVGVISVSLGGFPVPFLEDVIAHAVHVQDIIVCASAGNLTPFVVYPAAYRDCIAVAGTTPTDRPWKNSSFGPQVAVSAPASLVWVADFDPQRNPVVVAGFGTSWSAPQVAGAAALWLDHHGRERLRQRYAGAAPLQEVFRRLLRQTARNPGVFEGPGAEGDVSVLPGYTWQTDRYGSGIVDVSALLDAPLPPPDQMDGALVHIERPWLEVLPDIFPLLTTQEVIQRTEAFFGTTRLGLPEKLDVVGRELVKLLMSEPLVREAFLATQPAGSELRVASSALEALSGVASMRFLAEVGLDGQGEGRRPPVAGSIVLAPGRSTPDVARIAAAVEQAEVDTSQLDREMLQALADAQPSIVEYLNSPQGGVRRFLTDPQAALQAVDVPVDLPQPLHAPEALDDRISVWLEVDGSVPGYAALSEAVVAWSLDSPDNAEALRNDPAPVVRRLGAPYAPEVVDLVIRAITQLNQDRAPELWEDAAALFKEYSAAYPQGVERP